MMRSLVIRSLVSFALIVLMSCSAHVVLNDVYGKYVASYPFGAETISFERDGSFLQDVRITNGPHASVRGTWYFDAGKSRVDLDGSMVVVDGFGNLKLDWQTVHPGLDSMDIERHWGKVIMGSAAKHPYIKER